MILIKILMKKVLMKKILMKKIKYTNYYATLKINWKITQ